MFVDPLLSYVLVIDDHNKCLDFNHTLAIVLSVLHLVLGISYAVTVWMILRLKELPKSALIVIGFVILLITGLPILLLLEVQISPLLNLKWFLKYWNKYCREYVFKEKESY